MIMHGIHYLMIPISTLQWVKHSIAKVDSTELSKIDFKSS